MFEIFRKFPQILTTEYRLQAKLSHLQDKCEMDFAVMVLSYLLPEVY